MIHFHPISFELPKIGENHFSNIRLSAKRLKKRAVSVGQRSPELDAAIENIRTYVDGFDHIDIADRITNSLDARAFAKLFSHDELAPRLILSEDTLQAIDSVGAVIKRQTLMLLIEGYLFRYDEGLDQETLSRLGLFIQHKLARFEGEARSSDLSSLAKNRTRIFTQSGPAAIVSWSRKNALELDEAFGRLGLEAYCNGRYFLVCRYLYYIQELKSLPLGQHHKVLDEVSDSAVYMAPGKEMSLIGHEVISILIDRAKGIDLSAEWMRVILNIAGDPRVPENSSNYQKWWSYLGVDRIRLMRGWLAPLDLRLFLKVLKDYGTSSGNADLQRMYPSRKKFLEGLLDQGLVSNSRLFINPRAEMFLKKGYKKGDLPEYAIVRDGSRSMIYLQVGSFHMIEGSHNCKLWIFPKLPEHSDILDPKQIYFDPPELSSKLERMYVSEFGGSAPQPTDIVHHSSNFSWQHRAIVYLRHHGIQLDIEKLFSNQDYARYIKLKGL